MCSCKDAALTELGIISTESDARCTLRPGLRRMSQTEEKGDFYFAAPSRGY